MADEEVSSLAESAEKSADSAKHSELEAIGDAKGPMKFFADSSKDFLHKAKENIGDLTHKAKDSSKEYLDKAKENIEDLAHKAKDSSKDHLEKAKGNIEDLTQKVKDSSKGYLHKAMENNEDPSNKASKTAQSYQVTLTEATHLGETSSNRLSLERGESLSFPLSILAWCSTLCSKTASREGQAPRSFDVSSIVTNEQVSGAAAQKLEESAKALEEARVEEDDDHITETVEHPVTTLEESVEANTEENVSETSNRS